MQAKNLPTIDAGYWAAIIAASMCGANAGDLAAGPLGLGHVTGLLPMAAMFMAVIIFERMAKFSTVLYYWLAVIVLRTMATNISDFATHDLKISFPVFEAGLIVFMGAMIWLDQRLAANTESAPEAAGLWGSLPATNWSYWVVMLAAGTLGTAFGDWIAEKNELNFGVYWGSALCLPLFVGTLFVATRFGNMTKPWYWAAIVACRTLGTDLGDMLVTMFRMVTPTKAVGLWVSTACTAALLGMIVYFWRHKDVIKTNVVEESQA